ncbi:hypothetical protein CSUI_007391, partial [Cystoisospora suis]
WTVQEARRWTQDVCITVHRVYVYDHIHAVCCLQM